MKTYNVQKRVNTGSTTEIFDTISFDCLDKAEEKFQEILAVQETYAGEYNENDFRDFFQEEIEIEYFDDETDEFEQIKSVTVYYEGVKDKNNYKGEFANNYWAVGKFNGQELVYNFYDNGRDLNLVFENIKESELKNWFNY